MSSHRKLQKTILSELQAIPSLKGKRVLDLSCGDAEVLSRLAEVGCDCVGTRYREDDYILKGNPVHTSVRILENIDLTQALPFEDESFDIVILQEVIEHLPNHEQIIGESARLLKPGGDFFLSTPNVHRLHSRLHFLLTGAHKLKRHRVGWELTPDELYAFHFNPVDFPILHTLLHLSGIDIRRVPIRSIKAKYVPLLVLYPLILLFSFLEYRVGGARASSSQVGERELRRWMLSSSVLLSEQILVVGQKVE